MIDATASVVSAFARLIDAAARRVQPRALPEAPTTPTVAPTPTVRLVYNAADTAGASKRAVPPAAATPAGVDDTPVIGALRNLGFKSTEVNAVLPRLRSTGAANRIGEALQLLGRRAG